MRLSVRQVYSPSLLDAGLIGVSVPRVPQSSPAGPAGGSSSGGGDGRAALPRIEPLLLAIGAACLLAAIQDMQGMGAEFNHWMQQQKRRGAMGAALGQERGGSGSPPAGAAGAAAKRKAAAGRRPLRQSEHDVFYFRLASSHVFD